MIKNSKEWAKQRGLLEVNEIHGEEEWRIPVSRDFTVSKVSGTESKTTASVELEATSLDNLHLMVVLRAL